MDSTGRQQSPWSEATVVRSAPLDLRTSVAVDYWVIDETSRVAAPDCTATVPGAASTDSAHSVRVETPLCGSCGELQEALDAGVRRAVTAAHDRGCRLLPLGLRPDLLTEESPSDGQLPLSTAGTRIDFETDSTAVADVYNVLLALDPVFVLVNTTSRAAACGRAACQRRQQGVAAYRSADAEESVDEPATTAAWQPVEQLDDHTVRWRSLDPVTPTLLVDCIAEVRTVLRAASESQIEIDSFGNGFRADRLVLPNDEWRRLYAEEAVEAGVSSLRVRAYLERLGISTDWYLSSRPPTVGVQSTSNLPAVCRQRAADLEADVGVG